MYFLSITKNIHIVKIVIAGVQLGATPPPPPPTLWKPWNDSGKKPLWQTVWLSRETPESFHSKRWKTHGNKTSCREGRGNDGPRPTLKHSPNWKYTVKLQVGRRWRMWIKRGSDEAQQVCCAKILESKVVECWSSSGVWNLQESFWWFPSRSKSTWDTKHIFIFKMRQRQIVKSHNEHGCDTKTSSCVALKSLHEYLVTFHQFLYWNLVV